jgi:hypothetical protein
VNQIPWDSFQEKGNWVILIDCPLVSERSAALKQAGQYLKCLQEFSRTVSPVAAQMVSLLGLKQSLQGMEGKGLFCKVKDNQTGRRFYQVIFEIRNEDESHCQQVLQGLDETLKRIDPRASVQVLGEVQEKNP